MCKTMEPKNFSQENLEKVLIPESWKFKKVLVLDQKNFPINEMVSHISCTAEFGKSRLMIFFSNNDMHSEMGMARLLKGMVGRGAIV